RPQTLTAPVLSRGQGPSPYRGRLWTSPLTPRLDPSILYRLPTMLVDCSTIVCFSERKRSGRKAGTDTRHDGTAPLCVGTCAGPETGRFSSSAHRGGTHCGSAESC